ncbi:alpha/beta hydrolase [Allorhizocola rhizosphaerae]|uniref:alpha/beta hydrolase n=1 Tax=Allorhizocola rhizosphaerae TaxID=1872709 RepID=UPI001B8B98E7|nr:alpha/beta hydrolase [Allorhizocola rhizosphaerae]
MRRKPRMFVSGVLALIGAFAFLPAPASATPLAGPIAWQPCPDRPTFDCATISVPVDWGNLFGPRFELALARSRATDPAQRIGSLVINPGGPGGSGVDFVFRNPSPLSANLRARFDIVGFDPRGVNRSRGVTCDSALIDQQEALQFPRDADEFTALRKTNEELGANCIKHTGQLVEHVDTASVVRDLEAIRAALGEGDLTYAGFSYGTLIGQQYAEMFPGNIRAMLLDSNIDHSLALRPYQTTSAKAMEESFEQFADWCERTKPCALNGRDVRAFFDNLLARADRGEIIDPGPPPVVITPQFIINTTLEAMDIPARFWFPLAEQLAAWDAGTVSGTRAPQQEEIYDYYPILCEDFDLTIGSFQALEQLRRDLAQVARHTRMNTLAWTDMTGCENWPTQLSNPQHELEVVGAPKILVSSSRFDPSTPWAWAANAAGQIGSSAVLLTYDGVGHVAYRISPCVQEASDRYLITLAAPPPGSHCPAIFPTEPSAAPAQFDGVVHR